MDTNKLNIFISEIQLLLNNNNSMKDEIVKYEQEKKILDSKINELVVENNRLSQLSKTSKIILEKNTEIEELKKTLEFYKKQNSMNNIYSKDVTTNVTTTDVTKSDVTKKDVNKKDVTIKDTKSDITTKDVTKSDVIEKKSVKKNKLVVNTNKKDSKVVTELDDELESELLRL